MGSPNNSIIVIEEGPIIINIESENNIKNFNNNSVLFNINTFIQCQDINYFQRDSVVFFNLEIIFRPKEEFCQKISNRNQRDSKFCKSKESNESNNDNKSNNIIPLFKIHNQNIVEIEMCSIVFMRETNDKPLNKLNFICFYLMKINNKTVEDNKIKQFNEESCSPKNLSILSIQSSKFSKFSQLIRAFDNTILTIDSCFVDLCLGKAISLLNPLVVKISNTKFEYNMASCVQIKFSSDSHNNEMIFHKNKDALVSMEINNNSKEQKEHMTSKCSMSNNQADIHQQSHKSQNNNAIINTANHDTNYIKTRKCHIIFTSNTFFKNYGNSIMIEGNERDNYMEIFNQIHSSASIARRSQNHIKFVFINNFFHKNKFNGIFISEVINSSLLIEGNTFLSNEENGVYLNHINYASNLIYSFLKNNQSNSSRVSNNCCQIEIIIRKNNFVENNGFGLFVNNQIILSIFENDFIKNNSGGLILCSITIEDLNIKKHNKRKDSNPIDLNASNDSFLNIRNLLGFNCKITQKSSVDYQTAKLEFYNKVFSGKSTFIYKSNFIKNGGSGIKLMNYDYFLVLSHCNSSENVEYGLYLDSDKTLNEKEIQNFKNFSFNKTNLKKLLENFESNSNIKISNFVRKKNNTKEVESYYNYSTKSHSQFSKGQTENKLVNNSSNISQFNTNDFIKDYYFSFYREFMEQFPTESKVILHSTNFDSNLRSGIYMNNILIYLMNSYITENILHAIEIPEMFQKEYFKTSKAISDSLIGTVGGDWGEINYKSKFNCYCVCFKKSLAKSLAFNFEENQKGNKDKSNNYSYSSLIFKEKDNKQINNNINKNIFQQNGTQKGINDKNHNKIEDQSKIDMNYQTEANINNICKIENSSENKASSELKVENSKYLNNGQQNEKGCCIF